MGHIQPNTHLPKTPKIKLYTALITQSGTDAPTQIILQNQLGGIISWSRISAGLYQGDLIGAFPANRTALYMASGLSNDPGTILTRSNDDQITLNVTANGVSVDSSIENTMLEIRIYEKIPITII